MVNKDKLIIVIGRGHGGTRLISDTLSRSGIYMGTTNPSGDLIPAESMYSAVRLAGSLVSITGNHSWDFTKLLSAEIPDEFKGFVNNYIKCLMVSDNRNVGWKLPETILATPWIFKMFPDAYYIYWTRNQLDNISGRHATDNLRVFNVPSLTTPYCVEDKVRTSTMESRLESFMYQRQIVDVTQKPKNFIEVTFEDFVLQQKIVLDKISKFIGIPLVKIPVDKDKIGQYKC